MPVLVPMSSEQIKTFREEHGLTQAELASAIGGSTRAVEDWEAGRRQAPTMLRHALAAISRGLDPWRPTVPLTAKASAEDVALAVRQRLSSIAADEEEEIANEYGDHLPATATPAESLLLAHVLRISDGYNRAVCYQNWSQVGTGGFQLVVVPHGRLAAQPTALAFQARCDGKTRELAVMIDTDRPGERVPARIKRDADLVEAGVRVFSVSEADVLTDPEGCRERIETILSEMVEECLFEAGHIAKPWVRPDRREAR